LSNPEINKGVELVIWGNLLTYFPLTTYSFLFRVGYQWSVVRAYFQNTLSGEGILYLPISHLPIYPFIFHKRCRWSVPVFGTSLYERWILSLTYFSDSKRI